MNKRKVLLFIIVIGSLLLASLLSCVRAGYENLGRFHDAGASNTNVTGDFSTSITGDGTSLSTSDGTSPPASDGISRGDGATVSRFDVLKIEAGSSSCVHPAVTVNCTNTWCAIPSGCFFMGSPTTEACREMPATKESQHQVRLTHSFEIYQHEVTQTEFENLMGYNPKTITTCAQCPIANLTWHEAAAYCNTLSTQASLGLCYQCTGTQSAARCQIQTAYAGDKYFDCPGYRLPTEAEWEYAYRAGTTTAFYTGNITSCQYDTRATNIGYYSAQCASGDTAKMPVMQKGTNPWGLYDIAGNAFEWVYDWIQTDLGTAAAIDPIGPSTPDVAGQKVARGGACGFIATTLRAAHRQSFAATNRFSEGGVRCVRTTGL